MIPLCKALGAGGVAGLSVRAQVVSTLVATTNWWHRSSWVISTGIEKQEWILELSFGNAGPRRWNCRNNLRKKFWRHRRTKLSQRKSCFVCTRVLSLKHVALSCGLRGSILPIKVSGSNFHFHLRYEHCCCGMMTRFRTLRPADLK